MPARKPYTVKSAKTGGKGSDRSGAVQSPYKPKDKLCRKMTGGRR